MNGLGLHKAIVVNNVDPTGNDRVYIKIPSLTGDNCVWAESCHPYGSVSVPSVGSGVWVAFEGDSLNRPVWMGSFGTNNGIAGSIGTLTLPAGPDTLVGRVSTDTLTNKTLTSPVITTPTINGALTGDATSGLTGWQSYTPSFTGTGLNLGTSPSYSGAWVQLGKIVHWRAKVVFGSSGFVAGSSAYQLSLPTAANAAYIQYTPVGNWSGTAGVIGVGVCVAQSTTATYMAFDTSATNNPSRGYIGFATTGVGTGTTFLFTGTYEAA